MFSARGELPLKSEVKTMVDNTERKSMMISPVRGIRLGSVCILALTSCVAESNIRLAPARFETKGSKAHMFVLKKAN